jgi:hypothetical protein
MVGLINAGESARGGIAQRESPVRKGRIIPEVKIWRSARAMASRRFPRRAWPELSRAVHPKFGARRKIVVGSGSSILEALPDGAEMVFMPR